MANEIEFLSSLKQAAKNAHNGTSFRPEERGEQLIKEFAQELANDITALEKAGAGPAEIEIYKTKFKNLLAQWIGAKSRCISSMITGPARFPVARAQKYNNWEQGAYDRFKDWRTKVREGYEKRARKAAIVEAGGPLEIAKKKLVDLEQLQEYMKKVNNAYRAYKKKPGSLNANTELSESAKNRIRNFVPEYSWIKGPFAAYQLSNNLATIKNTQQRIAELERREQLKETTAQSEFNFEGGHVEVAAGDDRFRIYHTEKPSPEKIALLKRNGFKWSPTNKCWQRQITNNAKHAVRIVTGVEIK